MKAKQLTKKEFKELYREHRKNIREVVAGSTKVFGAVFDTARRSHPAIDIAIVSRPMVFMPLEPVMSKHMVRAYVMHNMQLPRSFPHSNKGDREYDF